MSGLVSHRRLLDPRSLRAALDMLRDDDSIVPVAGCTDLYVALNFGTLTAKRFMNLWRLDELRGITREDGGVRIGALSTYTEILRSPLIRRAVPMLAAAASEIGGVQIQNRGTLGGNVANASPAGDTLPVLAAADATVELRSSTSLRRIPFPLFYTGYRKTVARPDELIVALHVPAIRARQWFRKVGTRAAQAISKVVFAGVGGETPRIALGSVGPTVVRLPRTEGALAAGASVRDAQRTLLDEIAPIDDIRSTAEYRARVAANLLSQFLAESGNAR